MQTIKLIDWLNEKEELIKLFGEDEILKALDKLEITEKELTQEQDFQQEPMYSPHRLIKPSHYTNYIRVYKDVKVDGQYVQMEGYKSGHVETYLIRDNYQNEIITKIIKYILTKRFKWFKSFNWSIYGSDLRYVEIYLNTRLKHKSFKTNLSLYVPIEPLLKKDIKAIKDRNINYWNGYTKSSYGLNKKPKETLEQFNERKKRECKEYLEVFKSSSVKRFFKCLGV